MKVLSPCANKSFDFGKHVKRGKYHQNQILTVHKVEVWECTFDGHWPWRRFELCSGADSKLDYLHFYLLNYSSRATKFPTHWSQKLDSLTHCQLTKLNTNHPLSPLIICLYKYILISFYESLQRTRFKTLLLRSVV